MSHERSPYDYCPKCRCSHCKAAKEWHAANAKSQAETEAAMREIEIDDLEQRLRELRGTT